MAFNVHDVRQGDRSFSAKEVLLQCAVRGREGRRQGRREGDGGGRREIR